MGTGIVTRTGLDAKAADGRMPEGFPTAGDRRVGLALLAMAAALHGAVEPSEDCPGHVERLAGQMARLRYFMVKRRIRRLRRQRRLARNTPKHARCGGQLPLRVAAILAARVVPIPMYIGIGISPACSPNSEAETASGRAGKMPATLNTATPCEDAPAMAGGAA